MAALTAGVSGSYLGYLAQRLFLGEEERSARLRAAHTKAGRRIVEELGSLRGPVMKLGQLLSVQSDLLPEETLAELAKLQMQAPGMHPSLVRAQFKASIGRDPEDVFKCFEPAPFAAASLGQVHRAVTRDGETVAVKIQYPGIHEAIKNDFRWFRAVSLPAKISNHFPKGCLDEVQEQILAETDYRREAANVALFRKRLQRLPFVEVPRIHPKYSTDKVLTMSSLAGEHLENFLSRKRSRQLRDTIGSRLFDLYYFQLLGMEAFHADPHWGNYLFRADGSIGLVDFGCVKFVPKAFAANLRKIFLYPGRRQSAEFRAILDQRYALSGQSLPEGARCALVRFAENFYGRVYPPEPEAEHRPFDFSESTYLRDYLRESMNTLRARGALPEYIFLARAEAGLYQTLHRLGARVRTSQIVRKYINEPPS